MLHPQRPPLPPESHRFTPTAALAAWFNANGIKRGTGKLIARHPWTSRSVLPLVKAMRADGMPCVRCWCVRPVDAVAWLAANPRWKPYRIIPTPPQPDTCPEAREWLKAGLTMKPFNL
jgi:hypothetical protein